MSMVNAGSFSRLPPEILDSILSELDTHADLTSLALSSRIFLRAVVPRHSEYRVVRVRHRLPGLWAHLAKRADLSRNLRELHICLKNDHSSSDHYPVASISPSLPVARTPLDLLKEEEGRFRNILTVLGYLQRLEVFVWDFAQSDGGLCVSAEKELEVIRALSRLPALSRLVLSGDFRSLSSLGRAHAFRSAWNITNLQQLTLMGDGWASPAGSLPLKHVLKQSSQLKQLQIPIEAISVSDCILPNLRQLSLVLQSGATSSMNEHWNVFLENHPLLEDLWCNLSAGIVVPAQGMPKLKRLAAEHNFVDSIGHAEQMPVLECLKFTCFKFSSGRLPQCDFGKLQKLSLGHVSGSAELDAIAENCPALTWLAIEWSVKFDLGVWLNFLSSFRKLETFHGLGIWAAVNQDRDKMHEAILKLVQLCPKLQQLDHSSMHAKLGRNRVIAIIKEDRDDGLHVRYEVQRPPAVGRFDFMGSSFT